MRPSERDNNTMSRSDIVATVDMKGAKKEEVIIYKLEGIIPGHEKATLYPFFPEIFFSSSKYLRVHCKPLMWLKLYFIWFLERSTSDSECCTLDVYNFDCIFFSFSMSILSHITPKKGSLKVRVFHAMTISVTTLMLLSKWLRFEQKDRVTGEVNCCVFWRFWMQN